MKARVKKRLLLLVAALAVGAVGLGAVYYIRGQQRAALVEQSLADGMEAYEAGDYEAAVDDLGYYVARNKQDKDVLRAFADSLLRTPDPNGKRHALAIQVYELIIDGETEVGEEHIKLLELLAGSGLASELLDRSDRFLGMDPGNREATFFKVQALASLGRHGDAVTTSAEFAAENPDDLEAWVTAYSALRAADRTDDEIIEAAREAASREGAGQLVRVAAAGVLADYNQIDEAKQILESIVGDPATLEPRVMTAAIATANALAAKDESMRPLAQSLLRAAADDDAPEELRAYAAGWAWRHGELGDVLRIIGSLGAAPAEADTTTLGLLLLTVSEVEQLGVGDVAEGIEAGPIREALASRRDDDASAWLQTIDGFERLRADEIIEARDAFTSATDRSSGLAAEIATFFNAQVWLRTGERALAKQRLARLGRDPAWRRARYVLSGAFIAEGAYEQGIGLLAREPSLSTWREGVERLTLATVEAASQPGAEQARKQFALELSRNYAEQVGDAPFAMSLRARAALAAGVTADGLAIARSLLESGGIEQIGSEGQRLADAVAAVDGELAASLREAAMRGGGEPRGIVADALTAATEGEPERGLTLLESIPEDRRGESYAIAYATLLDATGAENATDELARVAETYPESVDAQIVLLQSAAGWEDLDAVRSAIARLKRLSGPQGARWRIAESRLQLTENESDAAASAVLLQIQRVLEIDARNVDALVIASTAARRLGDDAEAIDYLDRARIAEPNRAGLYPALITMLRAQGRNPAAIARLREFAEVPIAQPRLMRRRAEMLDEIGLAELAIADRERLAASGDTDDRAALIGTLAAAGRVDDAMSRLEALQQRGETLSSSATISLAYALGRAGRIASGLELLGSLPADSTDRDQTVLRADYLLGFGRGDEALGELHKSVEADPANAEAWIRLIRTHALSGNADEARDAAQNAATSAPSDHRLPVLAKAFASEGSEARIRRFAALVYATMSRSADDEGDAAAGAVRRFLDGGMTLETLAQRLDDLTLERPDRYPIYGLLAEVHLALGEPDDAIEVYRLAESVLPNDPRPVQDAARTLADLGRHDEAARAARAWAERDPANSWRATLAEAIGLTGIGSFNRAATLFGGERQRLTSEPRQFARELEAYAAVLGKLGRAAEASRLVQETAAAPEVSGSVAAEAATTLAQSDASGARSLVEDATSALVSQRIGRARLVYAWYQIGLQTNNKADLTRAIQVTEFDPSRPESEVAETWALLGSIHQLLGNTDQAESLLRAAVDADPDQADVNNNLAYLLVLKEKDFSEAIRLAEAAIRIGRERNMAASVVREYYDTLGLAHLGAGQAADAANAFREGLSLDPNAVHLAIGLAESLVAMNDFDEARRVLDGLPNALDDENQQRAANVRSMLP